MAGDPETGVSVMRLTEGLDSGPVALQERVLIGATESYGGLSARLAALGGTLMVRALELRAAGSLELRPQDDAEATYAEKIDPAERRLDPVRSAEELARAVRALTPHIGAYLLLAAEDGAEERLGVREAEAILGEVELGRLDAREGELCLGCGEGVLRLVNVQPPGGRPMAAQDYLRGHGEPARAV
jgi:methionyl-tRNA formyltransferase